MKEQSRNLWGWAALLGTPSLALLNQSVSYAMVTPACAHQQTIALHALAFACLAVSAFITLRSAQAARGTFLPLVGALTGTLLTLVILAQWIPVWMLSPCDS
jgi:hypothetical protein